MLIQDITHRYALEKPAFESTKQPISLPMIQSMGNTTRQGLRTPVIREIYAAIHFGFSFGLRRRVGRF